MITQLIRKPIATGLSLFGAAALLCATVPAFAATEWYVVKNEASKKCEVISHKPDGKTLMMIGTGARCARIYQCRRSAKSRHLN